MNTSSTEFSGLVRERILDLVWRQWVAIGIPGYASRDEASIVDPEPLLVLTLTVCRREIRLFDEVVAWLLSNGDLINVQRLRALLKHAPPESVAAMSAIAEILGRKSTGVAKWKQLATLPGLDQPTSFFLQPDGCPVPIPTHHDDAFEQRGLLRALVPDDRKSGMIPLRGPATLLLRLRALLGVSLRCEILCLLGAREEVHPSRLARLTSTAPRTMQKLLAEMERSGFVQVRAGARMKEYSLLPGALDGLLRAQGPISWRHSVALYHALERMWLEIVVKGTENEEPLVASSRWRRLSRDLRPLLAETGMGSMLRDDKAHRGEAYAAVFKADVEDLLEQL